MAKDRLVGVIEIAAHFRRPEVTVRYWRKTYADFPEPVGTVSKNPAWWLSDVIAWRKQQARENSRAHT